MLLCGAGYCLRTRGFSGRRDRPWGLAACGPTGIPGAGGPAAREARRPHFVRRRASKPARALRSLRRPPHQWSLVCCWFARRVGSLSGQAPPPPTGHRSLAFRSLRRHGQAHQIPPAPSIPVAVGVLHYTKPSGGVSPACRTLMSCKSPRLAVVTPRLTAI